MNELSRYDAACRAVAEAKSVDEVRDIRDRAEAMRAYARQAKNKSLEVDAAEIRMRAERRLGELIRAQKEAVGLATGGEHGGKPRIDGSRAEPSNPRPTLAEAGIDKKLSSRAQKLAAIPEAEFEATVADWRDRIETENERVTVNLLRQGGKAKAREEKLARLAAAADALPEGRRFPVICADPPWRFEPYSRETGMDRAADNHYPTMTLDEISAIDVPCTKDAVLFLWATAPMLAQALSVMEAWGFQYKTHLVWLKDRTGTGYWARGRHELLLIGARGNIPAPEPGTQPESVIEAPVREHSRKPDEFYTIIERIYPTLPRLEMFARGKRPGWTVWGNEAEAA